MRKAIIVAVVATLTFPAISQDSTSVDGMRKNYLSTNLLPFLSMATSDGSVWSRAYIQYRRQFKSGYYWKVDISARSEDYFETSYNDVWLEPDTDTSLIRYFEHANGSVNYVRFGMDYDVPVAQGLLTVGGTFITGLAESNRYMAENRVVKGPYGLNNDCSAYPGGVCPGGSSATKFFMVGFSVNMNLNMCLTDRLSMSLVYEPEINHFWSTSQETSYSPTYEGEGFDAFDGYSLARHNFDLLLRWAF